MVSRKSRSEATSAYYDKELFKVRRNRITIRYDCLKQRVLECVAAATTAAATAYEQEGSSIYGQLVDEFIRVNEYVLQSYDTFEYCICAEKSSVGDMRYVGFVQELCVRTEERYSHQCTQISIYKLDYWIVTLVVPLFRTFMQSATLDKVRFV